MMCVFFTPPSMAVAQQSAFGIIPFVRTPSFLSASICGLETDLSRSFGKKTPHKGAEIIRSGLIRGKAVNRALLPQEIVLCVPCY